MTRAENMRAGAHVLSMAANPMHRKILRTMLEQNINVRLDDGGLYEVSPEGREALFVAFVAERWLQSAPRGPLHFEGPEAEAAILALVEGWSTAVVHALAREPLDFKRLHEAAASVSRGELRRVVAALRDTDLIEVLPGDGGGAVYAATDWLRAGLASLAAAARVERRQQIDEAAPVDALDVEAAFRLSLPLLELPEELSGSCRLGVNLGDGRRGGLVGVTAEIDRGRVVACRPGIEEPADAWAIGPTDDWLDTVIEPDAKRVRIGGDKWLPAALLSSLHQTLFGIPVL